MKKNCFLLVCFSALLFISGCATERLPSEDLEVPVLYADIIKVLKDPKIRSNTKEKYDAAKALLKKVDLSFTRETKTINELFYHGDALVDLPNSQDRTISFNYQYKDKYVRIQFKTFRNFVVRTIITEK